jgi:hypothetical protein
MLTAIERKRGEPMNEVVMFHGPIEIIVERGVFDALKTLRSCPPIRLKRGGGLDSRIETNTARLLDC